MLRCAVPAARSCFQLARRHNTFKPLDTFARRHIGPRPAEMKAMLASLDHQTIESLTDAIVPETIRFRTPMWTESPKSETEILDELRALSEENKVLKSFIGLGYYGTKTPSVIVRNILESPGWYTAYTPYQAEISQGRLESLLNFQTMVSDLTGLPVANASLLDESTAVGECIHIAFQHSKGKRKKFFIDAKSHPQNIELAKTRALGFGIELIVGDYATFDPSSADLAGVAVQYPDTTGEVRDYAPFLKKATSGGALTVVISDLLALTVLTPPGEFGAHIACGSAQRFGVPLGFGGPHAAFLACADQCKRIIPGRIIGVSRDAQGDVAYRMALGTREQHIKREKATSNICTAQALLANMAAMYAIYHGPEGLREIAADIHLKAKTVAAGLAEQGHKIVHARYFDTIEVALKGLTSAQYVKACLEKGINIRATSATNVCIAIDETATEEDICALISAAGGKSLQVEKLAAQASADALGSFVRKSAYLTHPVFNKYHCEMEMQRYIYRLERKDLGLNTAAIPLGSCTMKLNAASTMLPLTYPGFAALHPFVPKDQAKGYAKLISQLEKRLCQVTAFDACSMQPNAGSQGEYAGLMTIAAYHRSQGDAKRNICLIPVSAHGTNPASAVMAGMKIVIVACTDAGDVDIADLKKKAEQYKATLSCLMITYPSTHGVFESGIRDICSIVHQNGGQVYMDGANLNAQAGVSQPGAIGADVCHINLHKTFGIPHGGGGPGMGPICCKSHLQPFLPNHVFADVGGAKSFGPVCAAPWGSANILTISYAYIEMLGAQGLKEVTQYAMLAANYMAKRLRTGYTQLFSVDGLCAHEFIIDLRPFKSCGVEAEDIAKRLMDYNFHAPTLSFPVPGTLMIEPTESESKFELDRLIEALLLIRAEIKEIEDGKADPVNNVLKNAPHTAKVLAGEWKYPYSREKAVFPTKFVKETKFWPAVGRVDNVWGDRNFNCCIPASEFTNN